MEAPKYLFRINHLPDTKTTEYNQAKEKIFVYLRLNGPLQSFHDKSWKLPNVEKM